MAAPLVAALVLSAAAANGATLRTLSGGDGAFNALCAAGNAVGTGNQACEFAVGEMRTGAVGGAQTWEVGVQNPPGSPVSTRNYAWGNGAAQAFVFSFSGGTLTLAVGAAGATQVVSTATGVDLGGMSSMFLRTRTAQEGFEGVKLFDMTVTGAAPGGGAVGVHDLPDLTSSAPGSTGAGYVQVSDVDWSADWTLAGSIRFSWDPDLACPCGSNLNVNFKLTDLETLSGGPPSSVIPLPAAGWLLLSGVAGLGWLGRRRAVV
ncbi:VPLPA-CTERM sorting domain-containing protein [Rhodobaculum claviforme]|uniref:VPLPA-CTERM sorting domain-containing protein n=1 Tax=Rhodobaculum claviforme TaxID=1549854 RepID=UPI001A933C03|nr:VPLPA-CTERM sorting domain-containing protein [Rhodobaculum claviforme]